MSLRSGNSLRPPRALPCFSRPLNVKRCLPEAPASNDVYLATRHQASITCQNLSLRGQRSYVELLRGGGRAWERGYHSLGPRPSPYAIYCTRLIVRGRETLKTWDEASRAHRRAWSRAPRCLDRKYVYTRERSTAKLLADSYM